MANKGKAAAGAVSGAQSKKKGKGGGDKSAPAGGGSGSRYRTAQRDLWAHLKRVAQSSGAAAAVAYATEPVESRMRGVAVSSASRNMGGKRLDALLARIEARRAKKARSREQKSFLAGETARISAAVSAAAEAGGTVL